MTRITKRLRLPNVTAYIVAGILMGPYCLNLIPIGLIERMDFIADIALAFIAFSTGEFFRFSTLKKSGVKVLLITFLGCYFQLLQSYRFGLFAGCRCGLLCHKNTRQIQRRLLGLPACRKEQKSSQQPWAGFNSTGGRCHWTGRDGSPHLGRCNGRRAGNNYPCLQRLVRTNRTCLRKIVAVPVGVVFQQVG